MIVRLLYVDDNVLLKMLVSTRMVMKKMMMKHHDGDGDGR